MDIGAPELLIILFVLGLPLVVVIIAVMAVSSARRQRRSTPNGTAGWYADPSRRFDLRYFDGARWTDHVTRNGAPGTDPLR